jgi:putative ABC transport system permease protein
MKTNNHIKQKLNLVIESFATSLQSIKVNKMRTILSLLGISIGIFTVITVFTVINSLERKIEESLESLGSEVVFVQKWPWSFGPDYPWWKYMNRPSPSLKEAKALKKQLQQAEHVVFTVSTSKTIEHQSKSMDNVSVNGVDEGYEKLMDVEIEKGRFFNQSEMINGGPLVVVAHEVETRLFDGNALGKEMKLMGRKYEVIGVLQKQGEISFGMINDRSVILSVNNLKNSIDIKSENNNPSILIKAKPEISILELKDELTAKMRAIRRLRPTAEDDFAINESSLLSNRLDGLFATIGMAAWIIGGFSLLVGGFGIANIMFVSVKERTSIIGIQKALGAKNYFVLMEFLFEAVFLSIFGGIIGLLLVFIITSLASLALDMPLWLQTSNIIMAISVSLVIGLISGIIPAYVASRLDPVEAIRK